MEMLSIPIDYITNDYETNVEIALCEYYIKKLQIDIYEYQTGIFQESKKADINTNDSSDKKGFFNTLKKIVLFIKKIFNAFVAWIQNVLSKLGLSFTKEHAREIAFVNKNKELNSKIADSLNRGEFNPTIKNWPIYVYDERFLKKIEKGLEHMEDIYTDVEAISQMPDVDAKYIIEQLYPKALYHKLQIEKVSESSYIYPVNNIIMESDTDDEDVDEEEEEEDVPLKDVKPIYFGFMALPKEERKFHKSYRNTSFDDENDIASGKRGDGIWNAVRTVTGSMIYHAGFSLKSDLSEVFSYSNHDSKSATGKGFVVEDWSKFFNDDDDLKMTVFVALVDDYHYDKLEKFIRHHKNHVYESDYQYKEILMRGLYKKKSLSMNDFKWVCSTFTNAVLNTAGDTDLKVSTSPAPSTIAKHASLNPTRFNCIFNGSTNHWDQDNVDDRVSEFIRRDDSVALNAKQGTEVIDGKIEGGKSIPMHVKLIRNYMLYGGKDPTYLQKLSAKEFNRIVFIITTEYNKYSNHIKKVIDSNNEIANKVNRVIKSLDRKIDELIHRASHDDEDTADEVNKLTDRSHKLKNFLSAMRTVSSTFEQAGLQIIKSDLFQTTYRLYRNTLTVYKHMMKG